MANEFLAACPTDCSIPAFPALPVDSDCPSAIVTKSQFCDLILDIDGTIMTSMTFDTPTMTTFLGTNIDNTNAIDNTKLKHLVGEGGGAEPEDVTQDLPKGRTALAERIFTQTWTFKNVTDEYYEFFRYLQCTVPDKFIYGNVGGHMFGSDEGIEIKDLKAYPVDGGAKDDVETWVVVITYDSRIAPVRIDNPL